MVAALETLECTDDFIASRSVEDPAVAESISLLYCAATLVDAVDERRRRPLAELLVNETEMLSKFIEWFAATSKK